MMGETAFVTGCARLLAEEVWPELVQWYRQKCALAMLDARDSAKRDAIALRFEAAREFLLAVENHVEANKGNIDGRATRYKPEGISRAGKRGRGVVAGRRGAGGAGAPANGVERGGGESGEGVR